MTDHHWTDRLSEHMDGELDVAESAACEAHLSACAECASLLEELRGLAAQASLLPDVRPARDLWPGIEARLPPREPVGARAADTPRAVRRRVALTVPQLVAAAIALVALSFGGAWLSIDARIPTDPVVPAPRADAGAPTSSPMMFAASYQAAISQLEVEFEGRRADLDPSTVRVVEENLAIIDAAIADAGQALSEDPGSAFLNTHMANALRQKVDLLRRAATIERIES